MRPDPLRASRPLLALVLTAACGGSSDVICPAVNGTLAYFDPELAALGDNEALHWLAYPFPADHRRTETGTIDLSDFPEQYDILGDYAVYGTEQLDGFGTHSPIYVAFTAVLDTAELPVDPGAFLEATAPIQLVDITVGSPEYGTRRPLRWRYFTVDGTWVQPNTLAVAPEWGFGLRERTTYALIITTAVNDADGRSLTQPPLLNHLLGGEAPASCGGPTTGTLYEQLGPLRDLLDREGIAIATVAVATVFTTQTITAELAAIYDQIQNDLPAPALDDAGWQERGGPGIYWEERELQWTQAVDDRVSYWVMEGRYDSPNYQTGDIPYTSLAHGGGFNTVAGEPAVDHWESLRFVLTIPRDPPPDAGQCYPIVEYAHGTTGSAEGFVTHTGARNAARGLATIGIDQPLHGLRWSESSNETKVSLYSFNFLNPASARTMFRQSAIDTFALTRFIRAALIVPAAKSPTGEPICFDGDRISLFGHSHGGISGAIAGAYESGINHWVLSGAGGGLSITMLQRNDVYADPKALIEAILPLAPDEELDQMHPVVGLIQLLSELTDPINYSPYWVRWDDLTPPRSFFITSGLLDESTPHQTATALSVAARIPIVKPIATPVPSFSWAEIPYADAPLSANVAGQTAGFMQWGNDGGDASHFVIFDRPEAINASMRFLQSAAYEGGAVLERDPDANVR